MKYKRANVICVLDIETTDRFWNSCGPIQIAALLMDRDGTILDSFNERIRTTHKIAPDASAVHGIYQKDLEGCRGEKAVLEDFCVWMQNYEADMILTYNGEAFDRRVLNKRCEILGVNYDYFKKELFPGVDGYYDCVKKAKDQNLWGLKDFLGRKWKLTLVAEKLGFSTENAHDALADVHMLRNIWLMVDPVVNPENWEDDEGKVKTRSLF